MQHPTWVTQLFQSIDRMDTKTFLTFLSDDAQFKFGNAPAAVGKEAVRQGVDGFFQSIKGLRHNILRTWVHPDTVICQGEATYTRHDGSQLTLPFVNVFGMKNNLVKDYLIYIDINPLYAPAK
jgi:ketosteroid isomerase-like protein